MLVESGLLKNFAWKFGILGFGIRNTARETWNLTNDWNPESKFPSQKMEFSTWNSESMAWNPESTNCLGFPSLRHRRNLTPFSKVCEASPKSLFWAPNGIPEITGNAFRICFQHDWQIHNGFFLTGQSWRVFKSWCTGGGLLARTVPQMDLTKV